jgi:malate synthase
MQNRLTDQGENHMAQSLNLPQGMAITADMQPGFDAILTREALELVAQLHRQFEPHRQQLLAARVERTKRLDAGERPNFLPDTKSIREGDWKIAPLPQALLCRRVEITGPVERKMIINALNSGADAYMTDFEDSNTPNWDNQITGQINLKEAVRGTISLEQNGKSYKLNDRVATLIVRPRGWHLDEKHVTVDGQRVSGGIFDFALFLFICRSWRAIWKRACGTRSSWRRRKRSACRAARFARPCSSRRFSPHSRWTKSCMNCANIARA